MKGKGKLRRENVASFIALNDLCPLSVVRHLNTDSFSLFLSAPGWGAFASSSLVLNWEP